MRTWCLWTLLAGCNQLYGLDETVGPAPVDSDRDGIADADDNCVLASNADQANEDGDALGDACDPCRAGPQSGIDADRDGIDDECDACPLGSNHDEDGDAVLDGCDGCPGTVDPDQLDTDGDGIGDACDLGAGGNERVFFDAFAPPDPEWNSGFAKWVATGDGYAPEGVASGGSILPPWNRRGLVKSASWRISTSIVLPATPNAGTILGLGVVHETNSQPAPSCRLVYTGAEWQRFEDGIMVEVTSPLRITMLAYPRSGAVFDVRCFYDDNEPYDNTNGFFEAAYFVLLPLSGGTAEFEYVDIIQ